MKTIDVSKLTQTQLDKYFVLSVEQDDGLAEFWLESGAKACDNEEVIMYAIYNDNVGLLEVLLKEKDLDVNTIVDGMPVWFYSLYDMKYFDKFKKLNLSFINEGYHKVTALEMAYDYNNQEAADILIELGADVNEITSTGLTLIADIINSNRYRHQEDTDIKWFDKLIEAGADINKTLLNNYEEFILYYAICRRGPNDKIINKALEAGFDVDFATFRNPHILICLREYDSIKKLIDYGANVNAKDLAGDSVLINHLDHVRPNNKIIELLLENGADPRVPDIYGKTPLRYARKYGNKEAVKLIKKYLKK